MHVINSNQSTSVFVLTKVIDTEVMLSQQLFVERSSSTLY